MEQNQNNDGSKRNPTEQSEGADQPLLGGVWHELIFITPMLHDKYLICNDNGCIDLAFWDGSQFINYLGGDVALWAEIPKVPVFDFQQFRGRKFNEIKHTPRPG